MSSEGEELYFQMPERVLCEKINLRSNITSNIAKKCVFPTFRLEYLKILTWYDNLAVRFGFSAKKYIKSDYCIPKKVNWPGCRPVLLMKN